tara:strand:- start:1 stop:501 length:501 start_codon:yes stop_codon:yes gene_type:complete
MATKPKIEGMVTKKRAEARVVNRYRSLAKELKKAKRQDELKGDSVSKKEMKNLKNKMTEARSDYLDITKKLERHLPGFMMEHSDIEALTGNRRRALNKRMAKKKAAAEKVPLIKAPKRPDKVPFTGGKAKSTPAIKRFAAKGKRGNEGSRGSNSKIMFGYKKGGMV